MPNRSIRDEMQTPRPPRVFGTPIGATGVRPPINTGRQRIGPAAPAMQRAALQNQIGRAAIPAPAAPGPMRTATQPVRPPMATATQGMPPPQAAAGAPQPTTLVPGNPTADLSAATAANRVADRPGLMNRAIDEIAR